MDDGFKAIKEDLFDAVGMTINRAVVKSHITHSAMSIIQIIQDEMKGILFCLKLDIAERMGNLRNKCTVFNCKNFAA